MFGTVFVMYAHILGLVKIAEWKPFRKELLVQFTYVLVVPCLFVVIVILRGTKKLSLVLTRLRLFDEKLKKKVA